MKILYFSTVFILFKSFVKEKKLVIYEKLFDFLMISVMFRKKKIIQITINRIFLKKLYCIICIGVSMQSYLSQNSVHVYWYARFIDLL